MARTLKTLMKHADEIAQLRFDLAIAVGKAKLIETRLKVKETAHLKDMLDAKCESVRGARVLHTISRSYVPNIDDWTKFDRYLLRTKALELLQRRVSVTAWRERYESGFLIPGTTAYELTKLSATNLASAGPKPKGTKTK